MLTRRLADISGPFFDPCKPFRNWSAFPYAQIDLPSPPYVDREQLRWGLARANDHLRALQTQGYTGVVIDNLAHLVAFDSPGETVYAPASPARLRALAYRAAFGELFDMAVALGMEVFVTTDMQWSTPELRRAAGPMAADNLRLAALNRRALAELFTALPQVRGLVVRVGEAGGAHDQGEAYAGHMIYTTPAALRGLIGTLLPMCEVHGRLLVVRTWSVGIGALGDLICSPARYAATFGGLSSPALLVSVKHGPADFFRLLPPNPTLGLPGPSQIVELQNRREYELFGLVPSAVAGLHGAALARADADPQCAGIWVWNSTGGWGGGQASLGDTGWSLWTELSSALTAALAQDPALDAEGFVRGWLGLRLGAGAFADAAGDLYRESAELLEQGWYLGQLPQAVGRVGGVHLSPLLWVWWMRPTAALPIWAYLAEAVGDVAETLRGGDTAAARAAAYAERLAALAPAGDDAAFVVTSARYFADVLGVAQAIKGLLLPLLAQARRGVSPDPVALRTAVRSARAAIEGHRAAWGARADFPALELDEVAQIVDALERHPWVVWLQARAACAAVSALRHGRSLGLAGAAGVTGLALALLSHRRGRRGLAALAAGLTLAAPLRRPALSLGLPWLNRRLHLLPSIFFEAGPSVAEWGA
ncbi:MAG: hypothetical protein HGA45_12055 [Chloroflexales bacterium]|nr:hypothetical protein [Chloroflexales bacterium]